MRRKIGLAVIAAVAFFGIVCAPSGRADEEFALLPTAVPSTTVSGGDIFCRQYWSSSLRIFRITRSRTFSSGTFRSRDFAVDYFGQV
jgi:hypothetical protein